MITAIFGLPTLSTVPILHSPPYVYPTIYLYLHVYNNCTHVLLNALAQYV